MTIPALIAAIISKHKDYGIAVHNAAPVKDIEALEKAIGFRLPNDFKEFYSICDGLECTEDIFRMIPISEIIDDRANKMLHQFHFAEYMIYSDMWTLRSKGSGSYEIFNEGEEEIIMTQHLTEFLERFLNGGVFEKGGLYDWQEEIKYVNNRNK